MKKTAILVWALWSVQISAQETERESVVDSVVIKARTKVKQERKEFFKHAQSTEIVSAYEIERNNPHFIEQSLGTMAGVQVDKRTQFGGQRVVLRGYGNDQKFNNWGVKFYLNSAPITNADGVTVLEDLDFSLINTIEVIKGSASTLYGGGTGGAVRFYIRPETQKGTYLSEALALGSFGLFQSNTKLEAVTDQASIMLNYGHVESQGFRPRGNTRKNNYAFMGEFKLAPSHRLTVYASHNNSFEGVTGQISLQDYYEGRDPGNGAYARKNAANHFIASRMIVGHQWKINTGFTQSTSVFFSLLDTKRTAAGAAEHSQQPGYGVRSELKWVRPMAEHFENEMEVGGEYLVSRALISNYRFDGSLDKPDLQTRPLARRGTYFKYDNYNFSLFLTNRLTYRPLGMSVLLGVSANTLGYDRTDLLAYPGLLDGYDKDTSFKKSFPVVFTPHVALQKKWRSQLFNLSYSEGYNAPTASTAFVSATGLANDALKAERARMWDFSVHGLLDKTRLDYQVSLFDIRVQDKLTQLWADDGAGGVYSYWGNTGHQVNRGLELSLGYAYNTAGLVSKILPYFNFSKYDFRYRSFNTGGVDYSGNKVVGVPSVKYSLGLDFETKYGFYLRQTFNYLSDVYTDFANEINVKGFHQYHAKVGYKKEFGRWALEAYLTGNNLTNRVNYSFLFVGNAVGDTDLGNGYPVGVTTDVNPGPSRAYFFGGTTVKYTF
ncbi:TonB-dependent receptor [Bergeyella sp. RCAD1439]|uniref:TonB-dependent receptor n=1 Tax=Bergeyella anatis TaxID=3113737 RepID=UPI002E19E076|nr:TonB-dependent receptor [Bergeyella sp. RCAD1439]